MFILNIFLILIFVIICSDVYINYVPKTNLVLVPLDFKSREKDNNIDLIALTTDELQSDKSKSTQPNYYWNGLIPQTIILDSNGEVRFDMNGMVNIDDLNKIIGELKGIDISDSKFSVESFNEYNSIISEKK